jgi:signal transduction histidine kinase
VLETRDVDDMATAASSRRTLPSDTHDERAARVAHELNNPLFAIMGVVELLLREAEPGTQTYARLKLIERTSIEMRDRIRSLLDSEGPE